MAIFMKVTSKMACGKAKASTLGMISPSIREPGNAIKCMGKA
jgi:hypothetical protein